MVALTVEWAEEKAKSVGTNRGTDGTSKERVRSSARLCVWVGAVKTRAGYVPLLVRFLDVHARATAI
jgi:hypothetical protein